MMANVSVLPQRLMMLAGMITSALGFLAVIEVVLEHILRKTGRIYLGISEKPQSVVREEVRSDSIPS